MAIIYKIIKPRGHINLRFAILLASLIFVSAYSCSEDNITVKDCPSPLLKFDGYEYNESFSTIVGVNTEKSENIDFTPASSFPTGSGKLVTNQIEIDTTFYKFDTLKIYSTGTISSLTFHNQTSDSAVLFETKEPQPDNDILLQLIPIAEVNKLVLVFTLEENAVLKGYQIKRTPLTPIDKSTFYTQPNPVIPINECMKFRFALFEDSKIYLSIYSSMGFQVKKIINGELRKGEFQAGIAYGDDTWNAKDDDGYLVTQGLYFAKLRLESSESGDTSEYTTEVTVIY